MTGYVRDGIEISPADSLYVLQYTVGKVRLNAMQLVAADVDMDGKLTAMDASLILDCYAALSVDEPSPLTEAQTALAD